MGRKKKKNDIGDVGEVRHFLKSAYGLDTQEINYYHLKIRREDFDGWFDWYHTTGTVVKNSKGTNGEYYSSKFSHCLDEEDLAIKVTEAINNQ